MEATQSQIDQILDEIASLSLDEQDMLINIIILSVLINCA